MEQLDCIKEICLKRRITNEFKELSAIFSTQDISVSYNNENKTIVLNVFAKINDTSVNVYTFIVNRMYPFHGPTIQFNYKPYSHYLRLPSQRFSHYLKFFINKKCLCCSSFDCKYNWCPVIKFKMIINEIDTIQKYKRNIVYKILSDQLKDKFLIDDIDIDVFLFPSPFLQPEKSGEFNN